MSDNRKYYYLKLKENYFDDDSIVLLESMQDGVLYSNILLKLYLKSLKHGGRLQLDEDIPYTAQMIATITRQQIGTVERALQIFLKLGLVEVLDSGTFYMSNIELLIGQSSTEAERKRAARLQNKALSAPRTNGGHLSDIRPPEIEIELEKEIEIKREIEKVRPETGHPSHTYGRYQNVFLTDEELADLQVSFPAVWEQYIEKLSEYMASTGKRYQSHVATITRQQIGTVERALQIFLKLGLVEVLDSGTFYMSNIELLIGQSSTEAERKRAARLQNKALSAPRTNGGHLSDIRPPEKEIELEKEIEIKREIEKGRSARAYGRYQNVFLTDEELADLQVSFPTVWEQYIEKLSEYMASTGKRYQSHAATIRRWAGEDAKKTITPSRNRDYSVKEDETV